jgi:hypothetical protein
MKLSKYIREERNIKSDLSEVKSSITDKMKKISNLKIDMYEEIGKKAISMTKSIEENEMEDFKYTLLQWIEKKYKDNNMLIDVEDIINAVIEKYY